MDRSVYCKKHDSPADPSYPADGSTCRSCHKDITSSHFALCGKCSRAHSCCIMCGRSVNPKEWKVRKERLEVSRQRKIFAEKYWDAFCIVHAITYDRGDRELYVWKWMILSCLGEYAKTGIPVDEKFRHYRFRYPPKEY